MTKKHRAEKELLEEIPTIRLGDRVLRRRRKRRGILHTISQNVSKLFKGAASK